MEIMTIASNVAPGIVALGECMDILGDVELMDDDRRAWKARGTIVGAPSIAQDGR
jgi:hypothetical protein